MINKFFAVKFSLFNFIGDLIGSAYDMRTSVFKPEISGALIPRPQIPGPQAIKLQTLKQPVKKVITLLLIIYIYCFNLSAQNLAGQFGTPGDKYEKVLLDQDKSYNRRLRAIKQINNDKFLYDFATHSGMEYGDLREEAAKRITDPKYLYLFIINSNNFKARESAILRLDDYKYFIMTYDRVCNEDFLWQLCALKMILFDSSIVSKYGKLKLNYDHQTKWGHYRENTGYQKYSAATANAVSHKISFAIQDIKGDTVYSDNSGDFSLPSSLSYTRGTYGSYGTYVVDAEINFKKFCKFLLQKFTREECINIILNSNSGYLRDYTWEKLQPLDISAIDNQEFLGHIVSHPNAEFNIKAEAISKIRDAEIIKKILREIPNIDFNLKKLLEARLSEL